MIRMGERLKQNQLFALALYITVTKLHVNSRRVIRLFFCFFYYSGKRPEYSNAIVHAFQKFKAPFSGKIVHIFPEQSAVI